MKYVSKMVAIAIGLLVITGLISGIGVVVNRFSAAKVPTTKAEYLEAAVKGCAESGEDAEYCRCFYSRYLRDYPLKTVRAFDLSALKDDFDPKDYEIDMAMECL
jgi:hypothetical protein